MELARTDFSGKIEKWGGKKEDSHFLLNDFYSSQQSLVHQEALVLNSLQILFVDKWYRKKIKSTLHNWWKDGTQCILHYNQTSQIDRKYHTLTGLKRLSNYYVYI